MSAGPNDEEDEDDDFYDEEYEDYFENPEDRPIAVDEFFNLPLAERARIWDEMQDSDDE